MENIKHIIESLLFVAEEPLTVDRIKTILAQAETADIRSAAAELAAEYEQRQGGFYLDEVAGGYQIRTRPEYTEWIKKLIQPKPLRLSKPALETLVIIAYKQPIIRSDIEHIRGVDCGGVLRVLLERRLIRVLGRKEIAGRPLIYATTKRFLEVFDLKSLRDLPTPKEIEELGTAAAEGAAANILDSAATSESLLESSGGIEAAGERIGKTESSETTPPVDEAARDTLRTIANETKPEAELEAPHPDQADEKSS
jgi:segregation and condensation protein B